MSAITPEDVVDSASIAAASTRRRPLWQVAIRNPNVMFGGVIAGFAESTGAVAFTGAAGAELVAGAGVAWATRGDSDGRLTR